MKKVLLACIFAVVMLFTTSCEGTCKIETVNENGETVQLEVNKTENPEEVLAALTAVSTEPTQLTSMSAAIKVDLDIAQDNGNQIKVKGSSNLQLDVEKKLGYLDLKADVVYRAPNLTNSNVNMNLDSNAYLDNTNVYLGLKYSLQSGDNKQDVNEKVGMTVSDLMRLLDSELPFDIEGLLGSLGGSTQLPTEGLDQIIEQYNITIPTTTSNTITFRVNIPVTEANTMAIDIEVDAKTKLPKEIKVDATEAIKASATEAGVTFSKSKAELTISFKYNNVNVKTLSDSDKAAYKAVN